MRAIAKAQDLVTADKKDSQGLCFVGKVRLPEFLQQKLQPKEGDIIEIPNDWEGYAAFDHPRVFDTYEGELEYQSQRLCISEKMVKK